MSEFFFFVKYDSKSLKSSFKLGDDLISLKLACTHSNPAIYISYNYTINKGPYVYLRNLVTVTGNL